MTAAPAAGCVVIKAVASPAEVALGLAHIVAADTEALQLC